MKIVFDISALARFHGPRGGAARVEREFADFAYWNRPEIEFSFYDHSIGALRLIKREWVRALIGTETVLDTSRIPPPGQVRQDLRYRLPRSLGSIIFWVRRFRHNCEVALERLRFTAASPFTRTLAGRLARRFRYFGCGGKRQPTRATVVPFDVAVGEPVMPDSDHVLVSVGSDWAYKDRRRIAEMITRHGARYVILCHDLTILKFPEAAGDRQVELARAYWHLMFPLAQLVVFTTRTIEQEVRSYCATHDLHLGDTAIVPLGWNPATLKEAAGKGLPPEVEAGKYVLYVSSLGARKRHDMMIDVWKRLLVDRVPQPHGFKLVFVGEHVFNTPNLRKRLESGEMGETLLHYRGVPDEQLAAFFRKAAFCIFPSSYEGFGLPVIEAFGFGKAVIASTGGALPEVAAGLAPCIDADDGDAWYGEIRRWIEDPRLVENYENEIRRRFSAPTWLDASERFFSVVESAGLDRQATAE